MGDKNRTRKVDPSDFIWYFTGILIRIVWTIGYPQQGYIHPDEFFQGPEIVFDDKFQTNLTRTHEFLSPRPLRSVAILYLLYYFPVSFLSILSSLFHWSSIPFNFKLICPRLSILSISFCTDMLFYRLMKFFYPNFNSKQYGSIMNYYGLSHVVLVFFTRTLSNSFESFLFLSLIYLININLSTVRSIITNEKAYIRTRTLLSSSMLIGFVCALGLFNRPTFPAFASVPIVYWLINIFPTLGHSYRYHLLLTKVIVAIVGTCFLTVCLLVLFDSYYYHNGWSFLMDLKNDLIICPLNFIFYNIDSTNLDKHGLHPAWLHFIVNATILYGPLHVCVIFWALHRLSSFRRSIEEQSISSVIFYHYLIPFIPLSIFPHQEARFLLPLIYPLILFIVPILLKQTFHQYIFRIWLLFNIILSLLYGHLHQGGLLSALHHVHNSPVTNISTKILVTYHTYMPPGYLVTSMTNSEKKLSIETIIIDLQGAKREEFDRMIEKIFNEYSMMNTQVFVILPGTCQNHLIYLKEQHYTVNLIEQFGPHLDLDHSFDEPFHVNYTRTRFTV